MKNLHNVSQTNHNRPQQNKCEDYPSRKQILNDMEKIFILAMEMGKINVALRAKELIGKELGFFLPPSKRPKVDGHKSPKTDPEIQVDLIQEEAAADEKKFQQPLVTSDTFVKQPDNSKTGATVRSTILALLLTGASLYSLSSSDLNAQELPCKILKSLPKANNILENRQKVIFEEN